MDLISLLILVATGLVVGLVARTLLPGTADSGGVMSFVASVIGAAVLLLIISVLRR